MKIMSKFQDYYDGGIAHGIDRNVVYARKHITLGPSIFKQKNQLTDEDILYNKIKQECIDAALQLPQIDSISLCKDHRGVGRRPEIGEVEYHNIGRGVIFFCGKSYPFYAVAKYKRVSTMHGWNDEIIETYYTFDALNEFREIVDTNALFFNAPHWEKILTDTQGKISTINQIANSPIVAILPDWKTVSNTIFNNHHHSGVSIHLNPCIKTTGFISVFDPTSAFQEINMFIGSVLNNKEVDSPPQTDKQKVLSHGFDPKYGFRNPSKK